MAKFFKGLGKVLLWTIFLFILVLLGLHLGQGYFVYPGRALYRGESPEWQARIANVRVSGFEPVQLSQDEGAMDIRGLWRQGPEIGAPAILWFHDRHESITEIGHQLKPLEALKCHIFAMEYRGYGQSPGDPSQAALVADAERVFDYMVGARDDVNADAVFAAGWGMGATLAVDLAGRRPVKAVLAFSPFTNIEDVFKRQLPFVPAGLVLRDSWDAASLLRRGTCPVFVVYGTESKTPTPAASSRAWKDYAPDRVTLRPVANADEDTLLRLAGEDFWYDVDEFLDEATRR